MARQDKKVLVSNTKATTPKIVPAETTTDRSVTTVESQPVRNEKLERGKALRQVIAAFIANLGTINTGLIFGFSAVSIPQLTADDSELKIDEYQASWVASLSSASTPIGCILSGYVMDRFGRKRTLLFTELPLILGWILIACATDVRMIYVGRILCGLGSGMVGAPARVYTSEVTQPHLRGMLTALGNVGISVGVLFQYTLGAFISWYYLAAISALIPILAFVTMMPMPESPNYLVTHSKPDAALKSLAKLRGSSYNLQREIDQLQQFANKSKCNQEQTGNDLWRALLSPSALKPFGILFFYFISYQFSGVNTVTFYAVEIFKDSGAEWDKNTCTILLGVVRLVFTIVACVALRRCGRRPLSFISFIGCGITMLALGFYMKEKHAWDNAEPPHEPMHSWIPVASILLFQVCCALGFLVVPWVMIGELYPMKVRGIYGGMTTCSSHLGVFIVVKTYPFLSHLIEKHGCFIVYGAISLFATIFIYLYLPETKGKTLQEIEDYYAGRITKQMFQQKKGSMLPTVTNLTNVQPPTITTVEKDKLLP